MSLAPILIMAGGTGGHVFPGLAVAEVLSSRNRSVVWLGTHRGIESDVVPRHGIEVEWISISGVRGRGAGAWLTAPFKIAWSVLQAMRVMIRRRPGAVLGLGGFVSGPGGLAAWITRRPLIIHEQNAVAGTTNRMLARLAVRVFEAFPGSFPGRSDVIEIGNPVRREIADLGATERQTGDLSARPLRLLVLGGSQGALALNQTVPAALARLAADMRPEVRHQAGRSLDAAMKAYQESGVTADCVAFIEDMAEAYAWADVVVARAGALTLSELAAAGVGAVLVPYPYAIDDHQTKNAENFVAAGAAVLLQQNELTPERLASEFENLFSDPGTVAEMGRRCHGLMLAGAAERLADVCLELAGERS